MTARTGFVDKYFFYQLNVGKTISRRRLSIVNAEMVPKGLTEFDPNSSS